MRVGSALLLATTVIVGAAFATLTAGASGGTYRDDVVAAQQAPPAWPHGGPGGRGPGPGRHLFAQLGLSDSQQEQIKTLREQASKDAQPYEEQLRKAEQDVRAAVESGSFSEEAVRGIATAEASAITELTVIRARTDAAIWKLLTKEQQARLAGLWQRPPMRQGHGRGM